MKTEFHPAQIFEQLQLPAQDLSTLSFCNSARPAIVEAWTQALPVMRVQQTSSLLYQALPEINRVKTSADNRLEMLEILRPYAQQCIQGLSKEFLNQPLILGEQSLKTAVVAQALQNHMLNGYLLVIREMARKLKPHKGPYKKLELACHRVITGAGLLLLRSYQLYTQIPPKLWLELNGVYRIAELYQCADHSVNDDMLVSAPASTLTHAYLRTLLLACARPNQMRQTEVSAVYEALENWSPLARIHDVSRQKQDNLFLVNLAADSGPLYKSRFTGAANMDLREIDLSQLVAALKKHNEQREAGKAVITIPHTISTALLEHLNRAWSVAQQRAFERHPSKAIIEVCVGLSNLHYQSTNGMPFDDFLGRRDDEESDEYNLNSDPWLTDFDAPPSKSSTSDTQLSPIYKIRVIDTSAGGYCLEWRDVIPNQVKAGELLGLRDPGRHRWGLGVVRWIQQQRNATRLGIQLLAPKATPYGAAIQQPTGEYSDYMRVLMLPELKVANQPATLLTASVPFQENNRLSLNHQGELQEAQLTRRLFSTGSIAQFTFRVAATNQPDTQTSSETKDFSSVWDQT